MINRGTRVRMQGCGEGIQTEVRDTVGRLPAAAAVDGEHADHRAERIDCRARHPLAVSQAVSQVVNQASSQAVSQARKDAIL